MEQIAYSRKFPAIQTGMGLITELVHVEEYTLNHIPSKLSLILGLVTEKISCYSLHKITEACYNIQLE